MVALVLLFALFAFLLAALAWAVVRLLRPAEVSGGSVRGALGFLLSGAVALGLGCMGFLGLVAFTAALALATVARTVESLPRTRVRVAAAESGAATPGAPRLLDPDPFRPLRLSFRFEGRELLLSPLLAALEPLTGGEVQVERQVVDSAEGPAHTLVDLALPACKKDLGELERAVRKILPELSLREGIEIELVGARSDW